MTDGDAVERLASVCERPHGNPTFGEKAEIAATMRALLDAKEAAEAERDMWRANSYKWQEKASRTVAVAGGVSGCIAGAAIAIALF